MNKIPNRIVKKLTPAELQSFHKYTSIVVLALIGMLAYSLFNHLPAYRMDLYNELWGPAYLLVSGQSPYDTSSLNPVLPAAWLPMAIGFFFPLGWLSENLALLVWFIFNVIEICVLVYVAQGRKRTVYNTAMLALLCFFFPPALNHFSLGQISITVTLCLVLAVHLANNKKHWLAAFFTALALTKPHLALLTMLGLSYHYYQHSNVKGMVSFWGRTLLLSLALCIPLFIAYPNWIPDALRSMDQNGPWLFPSLFILFQRHFGTLGYVLWVFTSILTLWLCYIIWKKFPPIQAAYWSLALAPLLTPYVGSWDFVILLPLFMFTYSNINWRKKILVIILYILAWYGMALVQRQIPSNNHDFWWVPLWFIGMSALFTNWLAGNTSSDANSTIEGPTAK